MGGLNRQLLRKIGETLAGCETIALASHARPDGDAIGSLVGLGEALRQIGKTVHLLNRDGVPRRYRFLEASDTVRTPADLDGESLDVDAFVVLDTATRERIGGSVDAAVTSHKTLINIDHHVSNERYGDLIYVDDTSPATGQIVYELIRLMDWPLSSATRDHLWTAIVTDTGSFQYSNTTGRTLEIGADLVREGAEVGYLSEMVYQNYPVRRLHLLRELLDHMELCSQDRIAWWKLSRDAIRRLGITPDDNEGLIDFLRAVDSVIVAVSFEDTGDGAIRVSCRSKSNAVDVSAICARFGGGGHKLAAGARIEGDLDDVAGRFIETVREAIES